jgi:hypothetical protein
VDRREVGRLVVVKSRVTDQPPAPRVECVADRPAARHIVEEKGQRLILGVKGPVILGEVDD